MSVVYDRVALIGLGLIASSMFWAIKRGGLAGEVTGYARSAGTRDTARKIGLCDRVCESVAEAVAGAWVATGEEECRVCPWKRWNSG